MAEISNGLSGTRQCWLFLGLVVILMIVGVIYPRRVVRQEDVPDGRLDVPGRILRWRC